MKKFDWKRMLVMAFAMILAVGQLEAAAVDVSAATKKQTLNATKVTLTVGKTKQLKVSNISASKVKWSSSRKSVATVSKTGKVTAKKKGTATITAKFSGKSLICKVTVKAKASSATTPTTPTTSDTPPTGKTLVVYYSATNSTERVANYIATAANADIFEIEPAEPYTSADLNWTDSSSRVVREYEDTSLRNVALKSTTVANWDSYDTVFIGYPIWWGIAAWPTDSFVKANDFTGKTVIPFCTSLSSGLGSSGTNLATLAGTGNWQTGQRFSSSASTGTVSSWVKSLGY